MSLQEENDRLKQNLHALQSEQARLADTLKDKLVTILAEKNANAKRAEDLAKENEALRLRAAKRRTIAAMQVPQAIVDAAAAMSGTADEVKTKIRALAAERRRLQARLRAELVRLYSCQCEQTQRLRMLQASRTNPQEVHAMYEQQNVLLGDKLLLWTHQLQMTVAAIDVRRVTAQTAQLALFIENLLKDIARHQQKLDLVRNELPGIEREAACARQVASELRSALAARQALAAEHADVHGQAAQWLAQNSQLRFQVAQLIRLNGALGAKLDDAKVQADGEATCELVCLQAHGEVQRAALADARATLEACQAETRALEASAQADQAATTKLTAELVDMQAAIEVLASRLSEATRRRSPLHAELGEAQRAVYELSLKVDECVARVNGAREVQQQNDDMRLGIALLVDQHAWLSQRLARVLELPAAPALPVLASSGTPGDVSAKPLAVSRLRLALASLERGQAASEMARRVQDEVDRAGEAGADQRADLDFELGVDTAEIKFIQKRTAGAREPPQIRAATIEKLVERLTYEKFPDPEFVQAFMLTYRSFTTAQDLLDLVIQRYCITPSPALSPVEVEDFKNKIQTPIRLRVFIVLRRWVNDYFYDFRSDALLVEKVQDLCKNTMPATGMTKPAKTLEKLLLKRLKDAAVERSRNMALEAVPVVRAKDQLQSFGKVDVQTLARVMTLIEAAIYKSIEPRECFGLAWSKKNKERDSPNILKLVRRFNATSLWIQWEVLQGAPPGKHADRAKILRKAIRLVKELYDMNNFNGAMAIMSGLQASPVHRLKNAWAKLDARSLEEFSELLEALSSASSYKSLRAALHTSDPPCVPYLGMYLTDLTFIEDGSRDMIVDAAKVLINFSKPRLYAKVLLEIQQYQQLSYNFEPDAPHHEYLERCCECARKDLPTENAVYALSLQMEPRGLPG